MIEGSKLGSNSAHRFFEVKPDFGQYADQWFLDEPRSGSGEDIDAREFTEGIPYRGNPPTTVPIQTPGRAVNFHLGAFDMPVVSEQVAREFERMAARDIELFPVLVGNTRSRYSILNVISVLDCLDEDRSEFFRWTEADGRADRLGQYRSISRIRVDPNRVQPHHAFRIKDWPIALLVSAELRDKLVCIPELGVAFEPAS